MSCALLAYSREWSPVHSLHSSGMTFQFDASAHPAVLERRRRARTVICRENTKHAVAPPCTRLWAAHRLKAKRRVPRRCVRCPHCALRCFVFVSLLNCSCVLPHCVFPLRSSPRCVCVRAGKGTVVEGGVAAQRTATGREATRTSTTHDTTQPTGQRTERTATTAQQHAQHMTGRHEHGGNTAAEWTRRTALNPPAHLCSMRHACFDAAISNTLTLQLSLIASGSHPSLHSAAFESRLSLLSLWLASTLLIPPPAPCRSHHAQRD